MVSLGVVTPGIVLGLALLFGVINAFDLPLRQSIIAEMVARDDLSNAIALNSAAFNTARVVGPSIAGILLAVIGEAGCFWINAVSFVPVLVSVVLMRFEPRPFAVPAHPFASILEGVRYVRAIPSIRNLLVLLGVVSGFGFQYTTLLPVYARDILDAGPQGYGLMVSAFGLGSLLSAVWMTRKMTRWDLRRNLLIGLLSSGLGMGLFAWSRFFPLTLAMGFLAGFGLILYVASTNMLLQITTEDRFRGRVMSIYTLMFIGTAPFGSLAAGWIAEHFGAPLSTSLSALTLLSGSLYVLYRLRALAQRETPAPTEPVPSDKIA
jgi:MFS family permease